MLCRRVCTVGCAVLVVLSGDVDVLLLSDDVTVVDALLFVVFIMLLPTGLEADAGVLLTGGVCFFLNAS